MNSIEYEGSTEQNSSATKNENLGQLDIKEPLSSFLPLISVEPTKNKAFNFVNRHIQLQLLTADDAEIYFTLFQDSRVTTHTGGVQQEQELKQNFELAVAHNNQVNSDYMTWVIRERADMASIGIAILTVHKELPNYGELGVMLLSGFHNQGYGHEILRLMIKIVEKQFCLLGMLCYTEKSNGVAQHVLKQFQFKPYESETLPKHSENGVFWRLTF